MNEMVPVVFVVDDDVAVCEAVGKLIRSVGWRAETFCSANAFFQQRSLETAACLVLDVQLPNVSGLELQRQLAEAGFDIPIIFLTGNGDVAMTVQAMKAGAVEFLTKPFRGQELLDAVQEAIAKDRAALIHRRRVAAIRIRHASLTDREKQVMSLLVSGLRSKQIGAELGTSFLTIKTQRGRVMEKMGAESLADLVRMSEILKAPGVSGSANTARWTNRSHRDVVGFRHPAAFPGR